MQRPTTLMGYDACLTRPPSSGLGVHTRPSEPRLQQCMHRAKRSSYARDNSVIACESSHRPCCLRPFTYSWKATSLPRMQRSSGSYDGDAIAHTELYAGTLPLVAISRQGLALPQRLYASVHCAGWHRVTESESTMTDRPFYVRPPEGGRVLVLRLMTSDDTLSR